MCLFKCSSSVDGYVNEKRAEVKFACDSNMYLTGVYNYYQTVSAGLATFGDRIWRFECCRSPGK